MKCGVWGFSGVAIAQNYFLIMIQVALKTT
jgi:hypothetical protein